LPTINDLRALWPFISTNPWETLTIFSAGLAVGWLLAKAWQELTKAKNPEQSSESPAGSAPVRSSGRPAKRTKAPEPFVPSDLQVQCIKVLRYGDDEWCPAGQVAEQLSPRQPRSDVEQALVGLVAAGWAADIWGTLHGRQFRLIDDGLDFARTQGFPVRESHY
jgi:hypothetical protein